MKTFYVPSLVQSWNVLSLLFLFFYVPLHAQEEEPIQRINEVGIRLTRFNLEDFGLIYKVQRLTNENRYMRYRLVFSNVGFVSQQDGDEADFDLGLGGAIGFERRHALGERMQFLQGPELYVGFYHSDVVQRGFETITTTVDAGLGYILGLQYNFNEKFYVNLETIPTLSFRYNSSMQDNGNQKSSTNTTGLNANFNSESIALTFAFRFGVVSK